MRVRPELDPDVDDEAPTHDIITPYDEQHQSGWKITRQAAGHVRRNARRKDTIRGGVDRISW